MPLPRTLDELLGRLFPSGPPPAAALDEGCIGFCIPLSADDEDDEEGWDDEPSTVSTALPNALLFYKSGPDEPRPEELMADLSEPLILLSQLIPDLWNARGEASICRTPWGGTVALGLYQEDEELWDVHATLLLLEVAGGTALVFLSQQLDYTADGPTYAVTSTPRIQDILDQPVPGDYEAERAVVIRH